MPHEMHYHVYKLAKEKYCR